VEGERLYISLSMKVRIERSTKKVLSKEITEKKGMRYRNTGKRGV